MGGHRNEVVTPDQAGTLYGLFLERVRRTPQREAYRYFDMQANAWQSYTWAQMRDQVARWQALLQREGLAPGERVAIMLRNCPQWVVFDQAAASLGLVTVPLYTIDRADNIAYIINDAQAKVLLFENADQWRELGAVRGQLDGVQRFISLNEVASDEPRLVSASASLPAAAELQTAVARGPDDLATLIYTSGTTGRPKGVMLSHRNLLSNTYGALGTFELRGDDLLLSFLPLSHAFERVCGYYLQVMVGATVAYARSVQLLAEDLQNIRPTVLVAVPRIYERVHAAIYAKLSEGPPFRRWLFEQAVKVGWARFVHEQGRGNWKLSFLAWPLLNVLVARKVLERLGGRLRTAVSGGAALAPEISHMFVGLGLPVVQGYGLTETSPIVSGNRLDNNFPESVGQVLRGVQVKLGEQNALLVKGPNVMLGYWKNLEATRAMIAADGWLNTGDIAYISDTGHIYITGRLKEIIVLANGEKLPPGDMEAAILHDPLIDQVMIYGEGRPYLIALVVVNPTVWLEIAAKVGVRPDMPESLTDSNVEAKVLRRIARNLKSFPGYAKVHRVLLLDEPWSIENGLLTPKLSLKRDKVVAKYHTEIDNLYQGH